MVRTRVFVRTLAEYDELSIIRQALASATPENSELQQKLKKIAEDTKNKETNALLKASLLKLEALLKSKVWSDAVFEKYKKDSKIFRTRPEDLESDLGEMLKGPYNQTILSMVEDHFKVRLHSYMQEIYSKIFIPVNGEYDEEQGKKLVYLTDALYDDSGKENSNEEEFIKRFEEMFGVDLEKISPDCSAYVRLARDAVNKQGHYRKIEKELKESDDLFEEFGL